MSGWFRNQFSFSKLHVRVWCPLTDFRPFRIISNYTPVEMGEWAALWDLCLLLAITAHIVLCPFTKVEESFNMQAMHDMLEHGPQLAAYDHHMYPGVVPRTFLGALGVASAAYPAHLLLRAAGGSLSTKLASQYLCRLVLGLASWLSYRQMRRSIGNKFGNPAGACFGALLCLQFHFPYYCSRSLPNTFALIASMASHSLWLDGSSSRALYCVAATAVVFRCDMVLLLGPMALQMLLGREVFLWSIVCSGIAVSVTALACSVAIDSYFWGRWLHPEGIVLLFNTVENRSSEWGVAPWHWYISSALPKGLLFSLPLGAVGILSAAVKAFGSEGASHRSILYYASPAFFFVGLYSVLPHKELRFILPVLPVFTMVSAVSVARLLVWAQAPSGDRFKPLWTRRLLVSALTGGAIVSVALVAFFSTASHYNYPGGVALQAMHSAIETDISQRALLNDQCSGVHSRRPARVHLDVLACVSGVTRFGEKRGGAVEYSKDEAVLTAAQLKAYDWVITTPSMVERLLPLEFLVEAAVDSFSRYSLNASQLIGMRWPVSLELTPSLVVMKNTRPVEPFCSKHEV